MAIIHLSPERRRGRAGQLANLYCLSNSRGPLKAHVIFLHGLGGHPYRTWQAARKEKSLWSRWLGEDIDGLAVWPVGYEAPISRWRGTAMHLVDRAENILGRFLTQPELKNGRITPRRRGARRKDNPNGERACPGVSQDHDPSGGQALGAFARIAGSGIPFSSIIANCPLHRRFRTPSHARRRRN
jgi:hypothetical protein